MLLDQAVFFVIILQKKNPINWIIYSKDKKARTSPCKKTFESCKFGSSVESQYSKTFIGREMYS